MVETEKLKFKIGLSGTHPDKQPQYRICVNDDEKVHGDLTASVNETEYVEFEADVTEGKHTLCLLMLISDSNQSLFYK